MGATTTGVTVNGRSKPGEEFESKVGASSLEQRSTTLQPLILIYFKVLLPQPKYGPVLIVSDADRNHHQIDRGFEGCYRGCASRAGTTVFDHLSRSGRNLHVASARLRQKRFW